MKKFATARLLTAALALAGVVGVAHAEITTLHATASGASLEDAVTKAKASLLMQCGNLNGVLIDEAFIVSTVGFTVILEQRCTN